MKLPWIFAKDPDIFVEEPHIFAKEPSISAKVFHFSAKEPGNKNDIDAFRQQHEYR